MRAHSDDANGEMFEAPVISLSLGASAIFLLEKIEDGSGSGGGISAILLRSGDVAILAGESRGARHGVARVFSGGDADIEREKLFGYNEIEDNISDTKEEEQEEEEDFNHFFQKRRISITLRTVR